MNILNLTPHALDIHDESGQRIATVEPSGQVARIEMKRRKVSEY